MAGDTNTNIHIGIDTSQAMAQLRALEKQLTALNRAMIAGTTAAAKAQGQYAQSLMHNVNATGMWTASTLKMSSATEQFANRLDRGKLSLKEYYRYGMASTKSFGKFFNAEYSTVSKLVEGRVKTLQQQYVQLGRDAQGAMNAMKFRPKMLNYNDMTTQLMLATQRHQILNKLIDDGATKLLNFGKNTQWAGRQLMVGFTIPLMLFAGQAVKSFKEIETQVIRFKKVYGDIYTSNTDAQKALKDIRALANEYTAFGVKVSDTIKMAADAAAAGNTGENLKNIVEQTTKLAVLGGITQDQALQTSISLQNAFDVKGKELTKTIDFLNAAENQTVLTIDDITQAIPKVAPVITQLGGNVQDLTLFLTAMKEGGVSAAQGANALKSGLASLINPTKAAEKAASQFGISINGIVKANEGNLRNTVIAFAKSLEPLTDLQRGQIIEKTFGKFQFARISALLNNITKDGTQAARVIKLTQASAEELAILSEREQNVQKQSPMYKMAQAVEKLKQSLAPIGEMFAKMIVPIANFFTKVFDKFSNLPEGVKKFVGIVMTAIGGIGPVLLMTVGLVANGIANLLKLFNLIRKGYQQLAYGSSDAALKTQYLSQEEIDNASVTNALYAKHEALSAAYRLETESLAALLATYSQANIAMGTFASSNPGMFLPGRGMAPRRFADGVLSVPGPKGAGDVVPAMLSPGEAVIPAAQTAKYGGFIRQIISDNVPGHMSGYFPAFGAAAMGAKAEGIVSAGILQKEMASAFASSIAKKLAMKELPNGLIEVTAHSGVGDGKFVKFKIPQGSLSAFEKMMSENEGFYAGKSIAGKPKVLQGLQHSQSAEGKLYYNISRKNLNGQLLEDIQGFSSRMPKGSGSRTQKIPTNVTARKEAILAHPASTQLKNYIADEMVRLHAAVEGGQIEGVTITDLYKSLKLGDGATKSTFDEYIAGLQSGKKGYASSHIIPKKELKKLGQDQWSFDNLMIDSNIVNEGMQSSFHGPANKQLAQKLIADIAKQKDPKARTKILDWIIKDRIKSGGFYDRGLTMPYDAKHYAAGTVGVPGYAGGVFLGMPKALATTLAMRETHAQLEAKLLQSELRNVAPTNFGHLVQPFSGHSFPVPGVGGVYRKPNGQLVVVKPMVDETAALAEMRATKIAREAHGLQSPNQSIKTMIDPADPRGQRKFIVLESPYEQVFAMPHGNFTKQDYIKQLVASALRGDKDLQMANLFGNVLTDVGTAGVFSRASGFRELQTNMPSMEEQAIVNLLGVKGGAKKFFAQATSDLARSMTPAEFKSAVLSEIDTVLPKLKKSIDSMKLGDSEKVYYENMIARLEAGRNADWEKIHAMHTKVPYKKYATGVLSVPGPRGAGDIQPAMLSPGEAVIPADMAQKYAPLIDGMITGSIPEHGSGKGPKGGIPRPLPGETYGDPSPYVRRNWRGKMYDFRDMYGPKLRAAIDKAGTRLATMAQNAAKNMGRVAENAGPAASRLKSLNTSLAMADKTTGLRGWLNGYSKVPTMDAEGNALTQEQRINARQAMRMNTSAKWTGIGMASMMVPMLAAGYAQKHKGSWVDKNQSLIMGAAMLPMLMPLINTPLKMFSVAVLGAAALFKMQSGQIKQALIDGEKQAKAMSMTTDNLEALGKYAGTVSVGQVAARQREGRTTQITPVSIDYGNNFLSSDNGKAFKANFKDTIKQFGAGPEAANVIATQLATAVQQKVLTAVQAESIATAFARTIKSQKLELQLRGKLIELIGPDGSDITKDPYTVQVRLIAEGQKLQDAIYMDFMGAISQVNATAVGGNFKLNPFKGIGYQKAGGGNAGAVLGDPRNWSEVRQLGSVEALGQAHTALNYVKTLGALSGAGKDASVGVKAIKGLQVAREAGIAGRILQGARALRTGERVVTAGTAIAAGAEGGLNPFADGAFVGAAINAALTEVAYQGVTWAVRKWQQGKEKEFVAKNAGKLAGIVSQNLLATQQGLDAVNAQYDTALANLETAKKLAKTEAEKARIDDQIKTLQDKKSSAQVSLRGRQKDQLQGAVDYYNNIQGGDAKTKYLSAYRVQMSNKFKDDPYKKAQAQALSDQLKSTKASAQIEVMTMVNSDQLTLDQAQALVTTLTSTGSKDIAKTINTIVKLQGTEGVSRLSNILSLIPDPVNQRDIVAAVKYKNPEEANKVYNGIEELLKLPDFVGIDIKIETQKSDMKKLKNYGAEVDALKKKFPNGQITLKALTQMQQEVGGPGKNLTLDKAIEQWDTLSKLPRELQFQAMITTGALNISDSINGQIQKNMEVAFLKQNPKFAGGGPNQDQYIFGSKESEKKFFAKKKKALDAFKADPKNLAAATNEYFKTTLPELFGAATVDTSKNGKGAGTGTGTTLDTSWLNAIAQDIKLFGENSANATKGLDTIKKFFGKDAKKSINPFTNDLKGALRTVDQLALQSAGGLSDNFRAILENMDPAQLELWSKKLLNIDKNGRITGLKEDFIAINNALKGNELNKFVETETKATDEVRDRANAYDVLTKKYKLTGTQALDFIKKNQVLTGDIANGLEVPQNKLTELMNNYSNSIFEMSRESKNAMIVDTESTTAQITALQKLKSAGIDTETALTLISKPEWALSVANSTGNVKESFDSLLTTIKANADELFKLNQLKETATDKLSQAYAAENAKIQVAAMAKFRKEQGMSVDQYRTVTQELENQRQAYEDQITNLNDGLDAIGKQEDTINKSYDDKIKLIDEQAAALEKIKTINDNIASQQKDQLDIASALRSGDIAAAAAAEQQYRANRAKESAQAAQDGLNARKDLLEKQRLATIDALTTNVNGTLYTKTQLTDKISSIEDNSIKPLQRQIDARNKIVDLYDQALTKAQANVEINGLTQSEFDALTSAVAALNNAYDTQAIKIDNIVTKVGGIETKWKDVETAIKAANLAQASYSGTIAPEQKTNTSDTNTKPTVTIAPKVATAAELQEYNDAQNALNTAITLLTAAQKAPGGLTDSAASARLAAIDRARANVATAQARFDKIDKTLKSYAKMAMGGLVTKRFAIGGLASGTDTVPAMLTPGEFVVRRFAVNNFGVDNLKAINDGTFGMNSGTQNSENNNYSSVYNYSIGINVSGSNINENDIARSVVAQIKNIDSQRIRGQK